MPSAQAQAAATKPSASIAVGPQYDTTHVLTDVTPTPSKTTSELVLSPVGSLSVFDYQTPIPYPFGQESHSDQRVGQQL